MAQVDGDEVTKKARKPEPQQILHMRFDRLLVSRIDAYAADEDRSRTSMIKRLLEDALQRRDTAVPTGVDRD